MTMAARTMLPASQLVTSWALEAKLSASLINGSSWFIQPQYHGSGALGLDESPFSSGCSSQNAVLCLVQLLQWQRLQRLQGKTRQRHGGLCTSSAQKIDPPLESALRSGQQSTSIRAWFTALVSGLKPKRPGILRICYVPPPFAGASTWHGPTSDFQLISSEAERNSDVKQTMQAMRSYFLHAAKHIAETFVRAFLSEQTILVCSFAGCKCTITTHQVLLNRQSFALDFFRHTARMLCWTRCYQPHLLPIDLDEPPDPLDMLSSSTYPCPCLRMLPWQWIKHWELIELGQLFMVAFHLQPLCHICHSDSGSNLSSGNKTYLSVFLAWQRLTCNRATWEMWIQSPDPEKQDLLQDQRSKNREENVLLLVACWFSKTFPQTGHISIHHAQVWVGAQFTLGWVADFLTS